MVVLSSVFIKANMSHSHPALQVATYKKQFYSHSDFVIQSRHFLYNIIVNIWYTWCDNIIHLVEINIRAYMNEVIYAFFTGIYK